MLIDWFTVIAQTANFLILVWLLKRFLYQPILNAIDAREQRIATQLQGVAAQQAEAQRLRAEFEHKNEAFDQQRSTLLTEAVASANAEQQRLLNAARHEAEALRGRLQETLRAEQRSLAREVSQRAQQEVFAIARKVLADLADTSLEQRMVELFLRHLGELSPAEQEQLREALAATGRAAVLRSAFELVPAQQAVLADAVAALLGAGARLQFEVAPEQVSGIELISNGHKVAWSITDHLAVMDRNVTALLHPKGQPGTGHGPSQTDTTERAG